MTIRIFTQRFLFTMLAALLLPTLASAQKSGYVWADNPTSGSYTPNAAYSFNSSGGPINISRSGVGAYAVTFAGIGGGGPAGGNVLVTAYGPTADTCKVVNWASGGPNFLINVRCFTSAGAPIDSRYSVRVVWTTAPVAKNGYAWADNPTSPGYTPNTAYSFNSSGGPISISRGGVGLYTVTFSGIGGSGSPGGNVQVTAYGPGNEICKVVNWNSGGADFVANVRCFAGGAPVDTRYSINVTW